MTSGALPPFPTISGSVAQSEEQPVVCGKAEGASPFGSAILSERSSVFRARGLGSRGRRWKSCRSDQFQFAAVVEYIRHPPSKRNDAGENPAGSAMPGSVKVARRSVKPFGVGASPTLAANFQGVMSAADGLVRNEEVAGATPVTLTILRKAGRYKLAAPVSKTGSVQTEVRAIPTPSAIVP